MQTGAEDATAAEPHAGEVYAVLTMPDGDYPVESTINEWQNKCPGELAVVLARRRWTTPRSACSCSTRRPRRGARATGRSSCIATTEDKRSGSLKG